MNPIEPVTDLDGEKRWRLGAEAILISVLFEQCQKLNPIRRRRLLLWLTGRAGPPSYLHDKLNFAVSRSVGKYKKDPREVTNYLLERFRDYFWGHPLAFRAVLAAMLLEPKAKIVSPKSTNFRWMLDLLLRDDMDQKVASGIRSFLLFYYEALPSFEKSFFIGGLLTASRTQAGSLGARLHSLFSSMGPAGAKGEQTAHTMLVGIISEEDRAHLVTSKYMFEEPPVWTQFEIIDEVVPEEVRDEIVYYGDLKGAASIKIVKKVQVVGGKWYALGVVRPRTVARAELEFNIMEETARKMVEREGDGYQITIDIIRRARENIHREVDQVKERAGIRAATDTYRNKGYRNNTVSVAQVGPAELQGAGFSMIEFVDGVAIDDIEDPYLRSEAAKTHVSAELDVIFSGRDETDIDRHIKNTLYDEANRDNVHLDMGLIRDPFPRDVIVSFIDLNIALVMKSSVHAARVMCGWDPEAEAAPGEVALAIEDHIESRGTCPLLLREVFRR